MSGIYKGGNQIVVEHESLIQTLALLPSGAATGIEANEEDEIVLNVLRVETSSEDGYEYTGTCTYDEVLNVFPRDGLEAQED